MTAVSQAPSPAPGASMTHGETEVSAHAMHRLAEAAASEVDGVSRVSASGAPSHHLVSSSAAPESDGPRALALRLDAAITYPRPVTETAAELRQHRRDRLGQLLGETPIRIDLDVTELIPPAPARRGRVR